MLPFESAWWAFPPANGCALCSNVGRHPKPSNFNTADVAAILTRIVVQFVSADSK